MNGWRTGMTRLAAGVLCLTLATIAVGVGPAGAAIAAGGLHNVTPAPPRLVSGPASQTVTEGANAVFTAAASGPALAVRWQRSTDGGATWADIPGQTSTTLSLTGVTVAQNGNRFRAVFTNADGTASTAPATLTVTAAAPPVITAAPASRTVPPGGNVSFHAASASPATVRWQRSTDGGARWADIPGQTSTTLSLAGVTVAQNGTRFRAVFTDSDGSTATPAATLTVRDQWATVPPTTRTGSTAGAAAVAPQAVTTSEAEAALTESTTTSATADPPAPTSPRVITVRPQAGEAGPVPRSAPQDGLLITMAALLGIALGLAGGILVGRRRRSRGRTTQGG